LFFLVCWLAFFWLGLRLLVGWPVNVPALPDALPTWSSIQVALNSPALQIEWLIPSVAILAWTLWAWTCLFVVVRVTLAALELATRGAGWVRSLQHASNWLMIPAVRRAVDVSIAGLLVARVATTPVFASTDAGSTPATVMVGSVSSGGGFTAPTASWDADMDRGVVADSVGSGEMFHTVRDGETWASISRTYFGTDDVAEQLLQANIGHTQPGGSRITRHGVICQGQTIGIPMTMGGLQAVDPNRPVEVEAGDTLWGIAARDLGDGQRWPDIYELSKGAVAPDGHVLRDPNLIWPGLVVHEPADEELDQEEAPDASDVTDSSPQMEDQPTADSVAPVTPTVTITVATPPTASATPLPEVRIDAVRVDSPIDSPVSPTPSPEPALIQNATPEPTTPSAPRTIVSPVAGAGAGGALGLAGLAGAALVLRRRHPRRPRAGAETGDEVRAGFAEVEPTTGCSESTIDELDSAYSIAGRLSVALATTLGEQPAHSIDELRAAGTVLAGVRHGRSSTTLILQAVPMTARGWLIAALPEAATRAFGERSDVEGVVSRDGDVLIRVSNVGDTRPTHDVAATASVEGVWPEPRVLLRLGLLADGQVFAANWDAIGHGLVAAPLGQGAEAVLAGLLAGLVGKRSPSELGLLVIGSPRSLPNELLDLPHLIDQLIDPHDESGCLDVLRSLRLELERRTSGGRADGPDIVIVLTELGELSTEHIAVLGAIMVHGPRYRIRVLAATSRRPIELAEHCPILPEFGTRLVLRTADEEESLALIGSVDATELGSGGHLLARLEGRVPLQAHGYRAAPDRLARLAARIRANGATIDWWEPADGHQQPESVEVLSGSQEARSETGEQCELDSLTVHGGHLEATTQIDEASEREPTENADVAAFNDENDEGGDELVAEPAFETGGTDPTDNHQLELGEALAITNGLSAQRPPNGISPADTAVGHAPRNGTHVEPSSRPRLRGRFLGGRELLYDGRVVWPVAREPDEAAMELLVFLAVQDPSGVRSEMLSDSFWETDDDDSRGDRLKKRRYKLRLAVKRLVPELKGDVLQRLDKRNPVHRLNLAVIESDVHRFLKLVESGRRLDRDQAIDAYEEALDLYQGGLLERPDVPPYRWLDDGPRVVDLRVKYASMRQQVRRRLADLLACGSGEQLVRAQELYTVLAEEDPLDHRLWEALVRLHGRRNDLLGLEATWRRLRGALVELGEGEDPDRVPVPPALAHVFAEVRASLL
jgi:hypothetical protein